MKGLGVDKTEPRHPPAPSRHSPAAMTRFDFPAMLELRLSNSIADRPLIDGKLRAIP